MPKPPRMEEGGAEELVEGAGTDGVESECLLEHSNGRLTGCPFLLDQITCFRTIISCHEDEENKCLRFADSTASSFL